MDNQQVTQQQIQAYGFQFAGNDEEGKPLFTAPNGQVVTAKVVYDFIREQERIKAQQNSTSSVEEMPQMPQMPVQPEQSVESSPESLPEKQKEQQTQENNNKPQQVPYLNQKAAPKMTATDKQVPYGQGFTPGNFDPSSLGDTERYVQQYKNSSNSSTNKWLAVLFEKFVEEYKDKVNKK